MWRRAFWGRALLGLAVTTTTVVLATTATPIEEDAGEGGGSAVSARPTVPSVSPPSTRPLPPRTVPLRPRHTLPPPEAPAEAAFLAAVEEGLEGTTYAGETALDPDSFVATGRLFCDLMADGLTPEEVLTAYSAALHAGLDAVTDDDLRLGGVVLGASIRVICPEHADLLPP